MPTKTRRTVAHAANTTPLLPDALYSRDAFIRASGIAVTRMREARQLGIEPSWLRVGKRQYLRGVDAIRYIEQLASISS